MVVKGSSEKFLRGDEVMTDEPTPDDPDTLDPDGDEAVLEPPDGDTDSPPAPDRLDPEDPDLEQKDEDDGA